MSDTTGVIVVIAVFAVLWAFALGYRYGRRVGYRFGSSDGREYERERLTRPDIDEDQIAHLAGWQVGPEFDAWCQYCGQKAGREFTNVQSRVINGTYHPGCLALLEAELRETGNL